MVAWMRTGILKPYPHPVGLVAPLSGTVSEPNLHGPMSSVAGLVMLLFLTIPGLGLSDPRIALGSAFVACHPAEGITTLTNCLCLPCR